MNWCLYDASQIKSLDDLDKDDRHRIMPQFQGEYFAKNLELADKTKEIFHKKGVTASQLTLAWGLAQGNDIFVIPGTRKEKYLIENMIAGAVVLSKDELAEVRTIAESFNVSGQRYYPEMKKHLGN
ncbi:hypothetical protein VKS41_008866 [Umbelopsis sp. WA50703]